MFDHVINMRGESRLSLFTGLPVIGSSEYAYGVSNRLTVGILGGFTPFEEAIGLRVRTVLYQSKESFRVYYCTPIIFYPQTQKPDPDPWFITRPNINFEWVKRSNFRYKIGGSIIASASAHDLWGNASESQHSPGLWSAVHAGVSLPVGANISFQTELSYVTKGFQTIDTFFGGPPFILITGISYTF
ncbi:hypothetical protein NC796_07020 [Aliifodinibius sp. S!AR15-10]|uniref:hypothetical protein n=1 Tax=Aliifodinibius sp. S!AR15-10 TaxID=2950437 RepID=UPI00285B9062|nr:hypothetical protein [Aliifodinibius sp. S!AR15-10]MDR8390881.1 hypothetical protein [Aliifodinibius sp. S!AR15-10]